MGRKTCDVADRKRIITNFLIIISLSKCISDAYNFPFSHFTTSLSIENMCKII